MKQDKVGEVVVSAGEPVAWKIECPTRGTWIATNGKAAERWDGFEGVTVTPLGPHGQVVLPEKAPDDLIELIWLELPGEVAFRKEAAEIYAAIRAWVAGGGETR